MSRSSSSHTITRITTALAATALAGLLVAAPASARQDPGTGGTDPAPPASSFRPQPPSATVEDGGTEYLQVGAGLLAGLALAGAGAAIASRRHPRGLNPA